MDFDAPAMGPRPARAAPIGVGTWATQAEFKDIRSPRGDKVLFQSDFAKDMTGWTTAAAADGQVEGWRLAADRRWRRLPGHRGRQDRGSDYTLHAEGPQARRRAKVS